MPRAKEEQRAEEASVPAVAVLQKFLKTYEKHCAQSQTSVCPAIRRDLQGSMDSQQALGKFTLVRSDDSSPGIQPVSLEPLLMTIREERYTLGRALCIWGLRLSNPEVARLALFLEPKGRAACPFTTLEIVACSMDLWSLGRLSQALQLSNLQSLVLDFCKFGNEEIECIFTGLEKNQRLRGLSLRYCGLGPWSGPRLGSIVSHSAICELNLEGNSLQCSGALALLRPMAEHAKRPGREQRAAASPATPDPWQPLRAGQTGHSSLSQTAKWSEAVTAKATSEKKKKKKGIRKKVKGVTEAGPWLVRLHLADNGIDGKGENLLEFTRTLTCLIRYSTHLREIDLGNNAVGEMAAGDILEALRARKTGKLPVLKITVTPQMSSDTFRSIWKHSKNSKTPRKKNKKAKN